MTAPTPAPPPSLAVPLGRLLAACALAALAGCQKPHLSLVGVEVVEVGLRKVDLVYHFRLTNPNSYQVSLWGLDCRLSSGGQTFASSSLPRPVLALSGGESDPLLGGEGSPDHREPMAQVRTHVVLLDSARPKANQACPSPRAVAGHRDGKKLQIGS
jgi:hypothetical protein